MVLDASERSRRLTVAESRSRLIEVDARCARTRSTPCTASVHGGVTSWTVCPRGPVRVGRYARGHENWATSCHKTRRKGRRNQPDVELAAASRTRILLLNSLLGVFCSALGPMQYQKHRKWCVSLLSEAVASPRIFEWGGGGSGP